MDGWIDVADRKTTRGYLIKEEKEEEKKTG